MDTPIITPLSYSFKLLEHTVTLLFIDGSSFFGEDQLPSVIQGVTTSQSSTPGEQYSDLAYVIVAPGKPEIITPGYNTEWIMGETGTGQIKIRLKETSVLDSVLFTPWLRSTGETEAYVHYGTTPPWLDILLGRDSEDNFTSTPNDILTAFNLLSQEAQDNIEILILANPDTPLSGAGLSEGTLTLYNPATISALRVYARKANTIITFILDWESSEISASFIETDAGVSITVSYFPGASFSQIASALESDFLTIINAITDPYTGFWEEGAIELMDPLIIAMYTPYPALTLNILYDAVQEQPIRFEYVEDSLTIYLKAPYTVTAFELVQAINTSAELQEVVNVGIPVWLDPNALVGGVFPVDMPIGDYEV